MPVVLRPVTAGAEEVTSKRSSRQTTSTRYLLEELSDMPLNTFGWGCIDVRGTREEFALLSAGSGNLYTERSDGAIGTADLQW